MMNNRVMLTGRTPCKSNQLAAPYTYDYHLVVIIMNMIIAAIGVCSSAAAVFIAVLDGFRDVQQ